MTKTITIENVDIPLLKKQRLATLIVQQKTKAKEIKEDLKGLTNLLDYMIDVAEGEKV